MRDIFTEKISCWNNLFGLHRVTTIGDFLALADVPQNRQRIDGIRRHITQAWQYWYKFHDLKDVSAEALMHVELEAYKEAKKTLPVAIMQGVNEARLNTTTSLPSRVLCIDIDAPKPGEKDNGNMWVTDWHNIKTRLASHKVFGKFIAYAGVSVGGRGVFLLIPIKTSSSEDYAKYYAAVAHVLQQAFNLKTDKACSNINRLRYLSQDDAPIINHEAEEWDAVLREDNQPRKQTAGKLSPRDKAKIMRAVELAETQRIDLTENYDDWLRLAAFFAHWWNDAQGREIFHRLASINPKYTERENNAKLLNLERQHLRPVGFGTFAMICKAHGIDVAGMRKCDTSDTHPQKTCARTHARTRTHEDAAPPAEQHPQADAEATPQPAQPQPATMSLSEWQQMGTYKDKILEGMMRVKELRKRLPDFDRLCDVLKIGFYGNDEWTMSKAMFDFLN